MFRNIRGDKERAAINWWELLQKLTFIAQTNADDVFGLIFSQYGVVPDTNGCLIQNAFKANFPSPRYIQIQPGDIVIRIPARAIGDFPSNLNILLRLSVKNTTNINYCVDDKVLYIGVSFNKNFNNEIEGKEPYRAGSGNIPMLWQIDGEIKLFPTKTHRIDTNNIIYDQDDNIVGYAIYVLDSKTICDELAGIPNLQDLRKPLLINKNIFGYDPCSARLSLVDMLFEASVQFACHLLQMETVTFDLVARVREIESRLGIDSYDLPTLDMCVNTTLMNVDSVTLTPEDGLNGGYIKIKWTNPDGYNYTHVGIMRVIKSCSSPPSEQDYKLVSVVRAESGEFLDKSVDLSHINKKHFYKIIPARAFMFGNLSDAPGGSIVNGPKAVTKYNITYSGGYMIDLTHMGDYAWNSISVYKKTDTGWALLGSFTHGSPSYTVRAPGEACLLKFVVSKTSCGTPRTTTTYLPYVPYEPYDAGIE